MVSPNFLVAAATLLLASVKAEQVYTIDPTTVPLSLRGMMFPVQRMRRGWAWF